MPPNSIAAITFFLASGLESWTWKGLDLLEKTWRVSVRIKMGTSLSRELVLSKCVASDIGVQWDTVAVYPATAEGIKALAFSF